MILGDLYAYYDMKPKASPTDRDAGFEELCPRFWTVKNVGWEITITASGDYVSCIPLVKPGAKNPKNAPMPKLLPDITRTSGVCAFVYADNAQYIFGGEAKRDAEARRDFVDKNRAVLEGVDDEAARAFLAFIEKGPYANGLPTAMWEELASSKATIAFHLQSDPAWQQIQNRPALAVAWERYANAQSAQGAEEGMCLVTGEQGPIARLFPQVTGVSGANSSGASLVSFNKVAFCSYGQDKANISQEAAYKSGEALRYLLKSENHRTRVGQDTVAFWTERDSASELGLLALAMGMEDQMAQARKVEDQELLDTIRRQLARVKSGLSIPDIDEDARYHILGIAPYQARLAVRFYEEGSLGELRENLAAFLRDTEMVGVAPCSMKSYLEQVAPLGKREDIPSPLVTSCMRALIRGTRFPDALYEQLLVRMRADHAGRNVWDMGRRAAMMRAYLVRRERLGIKTGQDYERSLLMALNEENTHIGYLLGRLFAVLEKVQVEAIGNGKKTNINATIRDRYIGSAATTPARVFPQLLKLAQHHISKSEYGVATDRKISEIIALMPDTNPFPATLTYDQQGEFYIGYYQQKKDLYTSKKAAGQDVMPEGAENNQEEGE